MARRIHRAGVDLIKHFEGFEPQAYLDPAGVPTIGYGHTRTVTKRDVKNKRVITEDEAEALLRADLDDAEKAVERLINVPLNDNQYAALVSFTFNLGSGNLQESTLRRKLNSGNYEAVPSELPRWVKAGGKTLRGLVRRRADEAALFVTPTDETEELQPEAPMQLSLPIEPVDGGRDDCVEKGYLKDTIDLERGSVDDTGDETYARLNQNVPDGYVLEMQTDIMALGFGEGMTVDGAFGKNTKKAVQRFQRAAGVKQTGIVAQATRDALVLWLKHGYTKSNPPGSMADFGMGTHGGLQLITPRVPHFSQGDHRWANRVLGKSSSISRQGCAIAAISMILRFYGRDVNPGTLDEFLDRESGYQGNSVIWSVAGRCKQTRNDKLKYHRKTGSEEKLRKTLAARVAKNLPTMVRVDYGIDADITYNHFVVCVGIDADGNSVMNDPSTRHGDGYRSSTSDNLIEKTGRKNGYRIVQLDYYDPA